MNPYKLKNVFEYLTSNNQLLKKKLKLGTSEIPIPPKKQNVIDIEAINRFNKANPRVDTTSLKPLSVKHSNVRQSNVGQADEGVIQGAFDTATREAQQSGFPAPSYDKFKSRYLKKNMKADGGRIGYKDGPKFDVQASGSKSGKQQIEGAPEGITSDKELINAILTMDIPLTEKVNLIGDVQYGKFRDKIEYKDNEIFLDDPKSYRDRNIGLDYNRDGEGFSGSATVGDRGPAFNIKYKKSFADGGMLVQPSDDGSRPGYAGTKGYVKPLNKEQIKLWDSTMADEFGTYAEGGWKKYNPVGNTNRRGNWIADFPRKQKIFNETRGLITQSELAEFLTEELGEKIDELKIYGRTGPAKQRTQFAQLIEELLYKGTYGNIKGGSSEQGRGNRRYFKQPNKNDIKKILKADVLGDVRINTLKSNTITNIIALDKEFKEVYRSGKVPDILDVLKVNKKMGTKMTEGSAGIATARLAQIYNGHKFRNTPNGIRVNKKAAKGMFEIMNNSPYGNPYRNGLYRASMQTIDTALGNKAGTFEGLKKKAKKILEDNKIPIYSPERKNAEGKIIKKATPGFNVNELAGVTGSARSDNVGVSQFIDIMEGNLNQKTMGNFQSQLSIARENIKGDKSLLSSESKRINKLARKLEKEYAVSLPRLADPDALKSLSTSEIKRLENINLGTGEDLYTRLVKDAEKSGYSIKMPKNAVTIQEFTESSSNLKDQAKLLRRMGFKCKFAGKKGGLGSCDDPASYIDDINKTKADVNSNDINVRNKAIVKNRKALEIAKTIPKIGKLVQKAAQVGASIITTPLKALGLTSPVGIAIEGAVEGGIYDYYRAQGYNHNQAYAETFTPKIATDAAGITDTGVGAFEGAQKLLDAEKFGAVQYDMDGNEIGIKTGNPEGLAKQYDNLYKNYEQEYNKYTNIANSLDQIKSYGGPDLNNLEQQLKIQTVKVNQAADAIKPGTPAYEAFQIAEESQAGRMDNRRREYLEKTRGTSEPSEFQIIQKDKQRDKAMLEMFPMYTSEVIDSMYEKANIEKPENFNIDVFNNVMRDQDKMNYFADNFRLEKASGGIASLTDTIPPESGPTPHGLRYPYNNVKKIKE